MRSKIEIKRDFNRAMEVRKDEFLEFQRQKLMMEVLLDIRDILRGLLKARK